MAKTEKRQPQKDFEAARGERQLRRLIGWAASEDAVEIHRALLELRECRAEIGWHRIAVKSLALSLFPDSPLNSAIAEFDLDAMGACQVIRRLRADLAEAIRTRNLAQEASKELQERVWQLEAVVKSQEENLAHWRREADRDAGRISRLEFTVQHIETLQNDGGHIRRLAEAVLSGKTLRQS
jgi:hypothetical protein